MTNPAAEGVAEPETSRSGGTELLRRVQRHAHELTTPELISRLTRGDVSSEPDDELAGAVRRSMALLVQCLDREAQPTEYDVAPIADLAVDRFRDGVSLPEILAAHHRVTEALWQGVLDRTTPAEHALLSTYTPQVARFLTVVTSTIVAACVGESMGAARADFSSRAGRKAIAQALLEASETPMTPFARVGGLPEAFLVLTVATESRVGADSLADAFVSLDGYVTGEAGGFTVLLPLHQPQAPESAVLVNQLSDGLRPSGGAFFAGMVRADQQADIPAAHRTACILRELNRSVGKPNSVADVDDFLLAHAVRSSTPSPPLRALHGRLVGLDGPLRQTLSAYLRNDCNTLAAARSTHLHRNSVNYRLRRVAEVTGQDPLTFTGAAALYAALSLSPRDRCDDALTTSKENSR